MRPCLLRPLVLFGFVFGFASISFHSATAQQFALLDQAPSRAGRAAGLLAIVSNAATAAAASHALASAGSSAVWRSIGRNGSVGRRRPGRSESLRRDDAVWRRVWTEYVAVRRRYFRKFRRLWESRAALGFQFDSERSARWSVPTRSRNGPRSARFRPRALTCCRRAWWNSSNGCGPRGDRSTKRRNTACWKKWRWGCRGDSSWICTSGGTSSPIRLATMWPIMKACKSNCGGPLPTGA